VPGKPPPQTLRQSPDEGGLRTVADFPIVAIGSSAGGLEACRVLLDHWQAAPEVALIIVQHLEPSHESMLVPLLATHTSMLVLQAEDGSELLAGHVYVIPPGKFIAIENGLFHLSDPSPGQGVRLPFDFLLTSLAKTNEARMACITLSGTGADGSAGIPLFKKQGGYVIAQDPAEASFSGMPRNAILTGVVDQILKIADMPAAIVRHFNAAGNDAARPLAPKTATTAQGIGGIIEWLHQKTAHDFRLYKSGTLIRRIQRRLELDRETGNIDAYLERLKSDPAETALLAQDLLINVTNFFRDPDVFDYLEKHILPDFIARHDDGKPLRIWVAGCSSGEEAYSLGMLILEASSAAGKPARAQIFASDVDGNAVTFAREGLYPASIAENVSPERLSRHFTETKGGYQVCPELRGLIVFTVQDLLIDPPFARIDLVSCRNVLIYLGPDAQKRLLGLFHFALVPDGLLLLGSAETAGGTNSSIFIAVQKSARLFRKNGNFKPASGIFMPQEKSPAAQLPQAKVTSAEKAPNYGDLCRRLVLENFSPAAVLINEKNEWLFAMGPTDKYLRPASGYPTNDLLALVTPSLRSELLGVIQQAKSSKKQAHRSSNLDVAGDGGRTFRITALPVQHGNEQLVLISFADELHAPSTPATAAGGNDSDRIQNLEHQLADARSELAIAARNLEASNEEQAAANAEATSINEEYQSANEELLTSKEELQSLNEELTALNAQLQETLDLHRTTSNDLQNVLYSTNVATIFLDRDLHIRFFTPATKALFNVIAGDIGRPLSDLSSLASDTNLLDDARIVLATGQPKDREIRAQSGAWFLRRILPYLAQDGKTEGVVITFVDVTERRHVTDDLGAAKRVAETATIAKSRFLAAASHDLRQPLQTLSLLQGLLATMVEGGKAKKLVDRFETTLSSMSGMLSTLLDINQIEAGTVHPEPVRFNINELFTRLRDDFSFHANAQGLALKVVPCSAEVHTDPRLLEQMLRNLLSNAVKYTKHGKILLGSRRRKGSISIEIWDTGIGIPESELKTIFEEYHQLDNPARERGRGLGLGLSIVQSLVNLLGYKVRVRSAVGKGSMFAIEILLPVDDVVTLDPPRDTPLAIPVAPLENKSRRVLIVEDDPDVRELLELLLVGEGYQTMSSADGAAALKLVKSGAFAPDLILADFNLPNDLNGIQLVAKLRERFNRQIPGIILTGDISTKTARGIELEECVQLNKPVKLKQLMLAIHMLLSNDEAPAVAVPPEKPGVVVKDGRRIVFVVDDDEMIRVSLREILEPHGFQVADFATSEDFLAASHAGLDGCLLIDAYLPGMGGLQLLQKLKDGGQSLPSIMITGHSDVSMAVEAMKAGAADFFEKPIGAVELLASIERVFDQSKDSGKANAWRQSAVETISGLTGRQREIMDLVLAGHPSKNIAADLHISQRTVENHRAAIMKKTGCKSLPALARLALAAGK
jgi:two-component system CheB/CheR fusion protein